MIIAGFGQDKDPVAGSSSRYFAVYPDGIRFWLATDGDVKTNSPLDLGRWQMLTATYDGDTLTVYKDAAPIMKKRISMRRRQRAERERGDGRSVGPPARLPGQRAEFHHPPRRVE